MPDNANFFASLPDPAGMGEAQPRAYVDYVRAEIAWLDAEEPRRTGSEAWEEWANDHEVLEDLADELLDLLDGT